LLASAASIEWAFWIDALSFLVSALVIALIRVQPLENQEEGSAAMVVRNLRAGVRFLSQTPLLRSLFLAYIPVLAAFGLMNSLLLPFSIRELGATEFQYGIQEGLTSVGFVVSSLIMAAIFDRMREGQWIALGWIGMGLVGLAYSRATSIPFAILMVTLSGFLNAPPAIGGRLIQQRSTPREMRGRVNSAFFVSRDVLFIIGMSAAGLADVIDTRLLYGLAASLVLLGGVAVLFLPGLRQDAAAWRRSFALLRGASAAPRLTAGRPATPADVDLLVGLIPTLSHLSQTERKTMAEQARVISAPRGTALVRKDEIGDTAYFITSGRAVAGFAQEDSDYCPLDFLLPGDFFGEIAALNGTPRTADVVAEEDTTVIQAPAATLRALMSNNRFHSLVSEKMNERLIRLSTVELPRFAGLDQEALRDLRTNPLEE
jgi:CRP-like cAMP-binding protein